MPILLLFFLIVNSITFASAGYDKYLAIKNKRRISENTLFLMAFLGGSPGLLLAMLVFSHKTSKSSFITKFTILFFIQILVVYLIATDKIGLLTMFITSEQ